MESDSMFCEHANEVPAVCKCDSDCYCKTHTCKCDVRKEAERITKNCAASKGKSSMNITLDWITPNAEAIIEKKGRICWQSVAGENDEDGDLIHKLIMKGHTSVLEHGCASFTIDGMSRACSHQLVRHRLASYSQKSQRYVSEAQFEYIIPHTIEALGLDAVNNYVDQMRQIQDFYNYWKKLGVRGEDARFVLPNACTTEIGMTTNFREWRGIFELRCDRHAQWEIREMCCKILEILHHECPNVFGDLYDKYMKQV